MSSHLARLVPNRVPSLLGTLTVDGTKTLYFYK